MEKKLNTGRDETGNKFAPATMHPPFAADPNKALLDTAMEVNENIKRNLENTGMPATNPTTHGKTIY